MKPIVTSSALWLAGVTLMAGALAATPALAQVTPERCALIGGASERLACYDSLFRAGEAADTMAPGSAGLWTTGTEISEIDGTATVYATLASEQLIPARPNGRGPARLTFQCVNDATIVQFGFAGQFMGTENSNSAPITLQFDRGSPQTQSLRLSNDRTAIGFYQSGEAIELAGRLAEATRLLVRATPLGQRSVTVSFELAGFDDAIAPVAAACGW